MENNTTFQLGPIQTKWLESLEQHPERQLKSQLGKKQTNETYEACCLGELGLIAGVCEFNEVRNLVVINQEGFNQRDIYLVNVWKELGLNSHTGARLNDYESNRSLAYYNDHGKTWPEIAAIVRANPEMYFNKSY